MTPDPSPKGPSSLLRQVEAIKTRNGWWQVREVGTRVIASTRDRARARALYGQAVAAAAALDRDLPKRGPCLVCGVPGEDQTHRVIDAIAERVRAGDPAWAVADDYAVTDEAVQACLWWTDKHRAALTTPTVEETTR